MKYRMKSPIFEAVQFLGKEEDVNEIKKLVGDGLRRTCHIMRNVSVGDYVMKALNGTIGIVKQDQFESGFEPVN